MRKLLALLGGLALVRAWFARRPRALPAEAPEPDPRADELRRRLEESRALVEEREDFESGETPVDAADPGEADPEARRRSVHERGRSTVDEMRRRDEPA